MKSLEEFRTEIEERSREKRRRNRRINTVLISLCAVIIIGAISAIIMIPPKRTSVGGYNSYKYNRTDGADLMASLKPGIVTSDLAPDAFAEEMTDFGLRLFKAVAKDGENVLISPLSVISSLGMAANGAQGETLAQMEEVFGLSVSTLNRYLYSYVKSLPYGSKYKLALANSIWFADDGRLEVNKDFLQTNANYYSAGAYAEPFDSETVKNINKWVQKNTNGMIDGIVEKISDNEVMYLINALAFDAKWEKPYESYQLRERSFIKEDGSINTVLMMYSTESVYYSGNGFQGVGKPYKDRKYSFVALLPDEGISVSELLESLDGRYLYDVLCSGKKDAVVDTGIPRFEINYNDSLADSLKSMGMVEAFKENADFSGLGTSDFGNIYISDVVHNTYISVDQNGTRAASSTGIYANATSAPPDYVKYVILDRPFVYMLIDNKTNIPFFIGTAMDLSR